MAAKSEAIPLFLVPVSRSSLFLNFKFSGRVQVKDSLLGLFWLDGNISLFWISLVSLDFISA
ncbi:hypothetical protein P3X46_018837 [Hevea brasiliensis]|uniref:Uncharacterized protein n=1 Tax=Hevea brasiliensis TaxID=3981 RepID=A0ABQ9LRY2_HEVBR|nr:hypothetical protein P3X46_018837 [Hevea brasiliensis]